MTFHHRAPRTVSHSANDARSKRSTVQIRFLKTLVFGNTGNGCFFCRSDVQPVCYWSTSVIFFEFKPLSTCSRDHISKLLSCWSGFAIEVPRAAEPLPMRALGRGEHSTCLPGSGCLSRRKIFVPQFRRVLFHGFHPIDNQPARCIGILLCVIFGLPRSRSLTGLR